MGAAKAWQLGVGLLAAAMIGEPGWAAGDLAQQEPVEVRIELGKADYMGER